MAYNILFTSMYAAAKDEPLRYYGVKLGDKRLYTDAMLTVEATTKYILSHKHIDEVLILGRQTTYDAGDDTRVLGADDGKTLYASDINELSTFSLYRYRLSQFIDDLHIEQQDIMDTLNPEEQQVTEAFIKSYYKRTDPGDPHRKFSRFFDMLASDTALFEGLKAALKEEVPGAAERLGPYLHWIKSYLYMNLKETSKMEILEGNETAKIRFVPTTLDESGKIPVDRLLEVVNDIASEHEKVNIFIALNNDDMTDNFVMLSVLDILDTMYGSSVSVERVYTATNAHYRMTGMIRNDTEGYGIGSLVTGINTFLKYGKVDMIVDYWEKSLSKNEQVEKMIYAMRRIDNGLSLCSIWDIEQGIEDLRELFKNGFDLSDSDYYSKLFMLLAEGIKKDYGRLVTSDDAALIDLVKWAFKKGFYQQCLTLIEARAPRDMVSNGIFYYCDNEDDRDRVLDLFAHACSEMKKFEQWKMDDLDHYYIKHYFYFRLPPKTISNQRENAHEIVSHIDNTDENFITVRSVCEDRQALEDLMFAYYHVGRIRNETNHAEDRAVESGTLFPDEKDVIAKLIRIQEGIQYYIQTYERVYDLVKDKNPTVIRVSTSEVRSAARKLENAERSGQEKKGR